MERGCFASALHPAQIQRDGPFEVQRAIATLHSFRFYGLVFILPGVVGPHLPSSFATFAAYGDFRKWVALIDEIMATRLRAPETETPRDVFDVLRAARDPQTGAAFSLMSRHAINSAACS